MNHTSNYQKHTSKNPLQRMLISNFYVTLQSVTTKLDIHKVLDAGCGEGFTMEYLYAKGIGKKWVGIDNSEIALQTGKKIFPRLQFINASIYKLPFKNNSFDLVLCNEVLEHLENPEKALKELVRVSSKYLIFSVPHEPFFMTSNFIRGKNMSRFGNDIEHINHWTYFSFSRLLRKKGLRICQIRLPFPWLMVLTEKNGV